MTTDDLENVVARLRAARAETERVEAVYFALTSAFEAANAEIIAARRDARALQAATEAEVREVALATWLEGDQTSKTLRPGIGIRETNEVTYDPAAAFAWAKNAGYCLQLDARRFERLAVEDIAGVLPPGLATVKKVPTVTIGKDLP